MNYKIGIQSMSYKFEYSNALNAITEECFGHLNAGQLYLFSIQVVSPNTGQCLANLDCHCELYQI